MGTLFYRFTRDQNDETRVLQAFSHSAQLNSTNVQCDNALESTQQMSVTMDRDNSGLWSALHLVQA